MKLYKHTNGTCNASGPAIRALREKAGISQEQLAAKLQLAGLNLNQKAVRRETASFFMRKSAKIKEMSLTIYTYGCIIILQGKGKPE